MPKKYKLSKLFLEVTRQCLCKCEHCLRGEPENVCMETDIIEKVCDSVSHVDCLLLTGGEPLLSLSFIDNIINLIKSGRLSVGYFRIITSLEIGTKNSYEECFSKLDELHEVMENKDLDILIVSGDKFHKESLKGKEVAFDLLNSKPYFDQSRNLIGIASNVDGQTCLIGTGRASKEQEASNPSFPNGFIVEGNLIRSDVYVSGKGEICNNCDLSYEDMKNFNFGLLSESSLSEIIENNLVDKGNIKMTEIKNKQETFVSYWNNLSEDRRGEWFGYVLFHMFDPDLPGYSIFDLIQRYPEMKTIGYLEDFRSLLELKEQSRPLWLSEEEDKKWNGKVRIEFVGFLRMLLVRIFTLNPVLELINLYYCDCPYTAGKRIEPFIKKVIVSQN